MLKLKWNHSLEVGGTPVFPGDRQEIDFPVARLPNHVMLDLPIVVINGVAPGPTLWISGAIHGDEVNGALMIRDVVDSLKPSDLSGAIIAVPIVNVFGFIHQSRYLPDRRDLNRCFPGSGRGSLAARMAKSFLNEVVAHCDYGIDIHTGSLNRVNVPQIRVEPTDRKAKEIAKAFAPEVIIYKSPEKGSLRRAAASLGVPNIIFEGGEANRFDREVIKAGAAGIRRVLKHLKMIRGKGVPAARSKSLICESSQWVRAKQSGLLRVFVKNGNLVEKGQLLASVTDVYGNNRSDLKSPGRGVVIGQSANTIVYQGDAVIHMGQLKDLRGKRVKSGPSVNRD